ncbi:DUF305 domain-containing protein [Nonomuraea recticatena]
MIAHHEGAIEMAKTGQEQGANDEARKLAETIVPGAPAGGIARCVSDVGMSAGSRRPRP